MSKGNKLKRDKSGKSKEWRDIFPLGGGTAGITVKHKGAVEPTPMHWSKCPQNLYTVST